MSHAVDLSLPREALKGVLEAALDPKRLPQSYAVRSAVSPINDVSVPTHEAIWDNLDWMIQGTLKH